MATILALRATARRLVVAYAMTSTTAARGLMIATSSRRPDSAAPMGEPEHPAAWFAQRLDETTSIVELERLIEQLRGELEHVRRRQLFALRVETRAELDARIVERGEGVDVLDVAIAMRTSVAVVRKARLGAGCDADWGRRLVLDDVEQGVALGVALISRGGLSVRAASAACGVARSTLHDAVRRV